jgi:hypothetical protein
MKKVKKVRYKEMKGSGYICPVCKEGGLVEIKSDKDFGNVVIKFRTKDEIGFVFKCKTKNDNFFLCKNEKCRARFERSEQPKEGKRLGPPCPTINCEGSLDTLKNVPIAKVYPVKGSERVILTYHTKEPSYFHIESGQLSYDEAGVCGLCHYVGPKEIDMR